MTRKKAEPKVDEPPKLNRKAIPSRFRHAEEVRLTFLFIAEAGTTIDDVCEPRFWRPVYRDLRPWSRIEVAEECGAWFAELLVLSASETGADVAVLHHVELPGVGAAGRNPPRAEGYAVRYAGAHRQWAIYHDGEALRDGFRTEAEAQGWMASHADAVARGPGPEAA